MVHSHLLGYSQIHTLAPSFSNGEVCANGPKFKNGIFKMIKYYQHLNADKNAKMKWFSMLEYRTSVLEGIVRGKRIHYSSELMANRAAYLKAAVSFFHPQGPGNKATK